MSADIFTSSSSSLFAEATGRVDIVFSQPSTSLRWIESTTECRHIESLFLLVDDARDAHIKQLLNVFPHCVEQNRVVRYANVKLDQHFAESHCHFPDHRDPHRVRVRPWFGQLIRVETRFTAIGNTSVKFSHRFLTVPKSQANRDFNNRDEDHLYATPIQGEEPERVFASAEGGVVFIKWQTSEAGFRFFRPTPGIFQGELAKHLVAPSTVTFLRPEAPEKRSVGSVRPGNAYRVQIHLRKSDEDELGHVTNSRYVSLIHDVLTFGLRTGYYANGSGAQRTTVDLPTIVTPSSTLSSSSTPSLSSLVPTTEIAVPAGSAFYKKADVVELFTGYERELKVKPGVYVWTWVEPERIRNEFDVVRFEICAIDDHGQEQVVSLCRAIVREDVPKLQASL
ncbi:hypothetical protein BGZ83_009483 [Gryganskiella cystojenkinii]|nr:hypothetical protein BGZ83_009483 [Gryganskiella cystojenkinii]